MVDAMTNQPTNQTRARDTLEHVDGDDYLTALAACANYDVGIGLSDGTDRPAPVANECDRWRVLDARFGTDRRSPLHHDNRCEVCAIGVQP